MPGEAAGHWGGKNPWGSPFFVVTHRPAEQPPGDGFVFTGSLVEAIDQAKAAAGGKQVHVMGGADLIRQALAAGLAGELTAGGKPLAQAQIKASQIKAAAG
ncbi:MAG TPA: hypothetical protein VMV17_11080 [Streptosporangiaceae bacterium]|nr:hypothetical protein [Streptosporangiaceae bacterium]